MPPYEYRVCAVPDPREEFTWDVTVYIRKTMNEGGEDRWRMVHQHHVRSTFNGDRPAAYWSQILKALKV